MNDNEWALPAYGITFNTNSADDTGCKYWITKVAGWRGGAATRPQLDPKPSAHGNHRRPNYSAGLEFSWDGTFDGPTAVARSAAEQKLRTIGRDPNSLVEVRFADALAEVFCMVDVDGLPMVDVDDDQDGIFSFQFASRDPRRYAIAQTTGGNTGLAASSGGLDWSTGGGLDWSTGGGLNWGTVTSTGQINFVNTGKAETDPVFTITVPTGTLANPTITFKTGQRLRYNGTLTATDSLRIDTSEFTRSVVLNGSTDARVNLTVAEWFQIPVGASWVTFSADNANAAANLAGSAYNAYW